MLFLGVSIPDNLTNVKHVRIRFSENACSLTTKKGVEIASFSNKKKAQKWWSDYSQHQGLIQNSQPDVRKSTVTMKTPYKYLSSVTPFTSSVFCYACQGDGGVNSNCYKCHGTGWA